MIYFCTIFRLPSSNTLLVITMKPKSNQSLHAHHALILHPTEVLSKKNSMFFQAILLFNFRTLIKCHSYLTSLCVCAMSLLRSIEN
jgi:hypothetical protein